MKARFWIGKAEVKLAKNKSWRAIVPSCEASVENEDKHHQSSLGEFEKIQQPVHQGLPDQLLGPDKLIPVKPVLAQGKVGEVPVMRLSRI